MPLKFGSNKVELFNIKGERRNESYLTRYRTKLKKKTSLLIKAMHCSQHPLHTEDIAHSGDTVPI